MKIVCDYFIVKCKISYLLYILWNSKGLPRSFFPWNLRHVDFVKNNHTIFNQLLLRLYASMNCVTSQFTVSPFSAHTLRGVCHFSKQSMTHRPTSHFLQQKRVLLVFLFSVHARQRLCFPLTSVANVSPLVDSVGPPMNEVSLEKRHWPWYLPRAFVQSNLALGFSGIV
jgi:hypothetical protein